MADPNPQSLAFPFGNKGVNLKKDVALLQAGGEYQILTNLYSPQEGALWTRLGSRKLGQMANTEVAPHTIRKLQVVNTETPYTPSVNPRYIGDDDRIWRTPDYVTFTQVASGVASTSGVGAASRRWGFAPYSAGASAQSWAFFAGDQKMLKDNGSAYVAGSGLATLQNWGIIPAFGVCKAQPGSAFTITNVANAADGSYTAAQVTTAAAAGVANATQVAINNVQGITGCNGVFWAHSAGVGATTFFLYQDQGLTLPVVGDGTYSSPTNTAFGSPTGSGNLDNSTAPLTQYDWAFAWVNPTTGNAGNPSRPMLDNTGVLYGCPQWISHNSVTVTVYAIGTDTQIAGANSIAIYRQGGSYTDGIWRLVGYATNAGGNEAAITFTDNASDADLLYAPQAVFDNDPPVTSTLPNPYIATLTVAAGTPGFQTLTLSSTVPTNINPGSLVHITPKGSTGGTGETVVLESINPSGAGVNTIRVFTQFAHVIGDIVEVDASANTKCNLAVAAFDSVFVAGDPNNPHVLYKSKTGLPESFPVIDANQIAHSINVGTPANSIVNICDSGHGTILCLNVESVYEVAVQQGQMLGPWQTPCKRGLYSKYAWCKADNEIWYMAYDGLYSWDGSQCLKRSEAIDPIFQGLSVNGYNPISRDPNDLQWCRLSYYKNIITFGYRQSGGKSIIARYNTIYDRWWFEDRVSQLPVSAGNGQFTEWYLEEDTGNYIWSRYDTGGGVMLLDDQSKLSGSNVITADEYVTSPDPLGGDGYGITANFLTGYFNLGDPLLQKLFQEFALECDPQSNFGMFAYYDMSTTADTKDSFGVNAAVSAPARQRVQFVSQYNSPGGGIPTSSMGKEMYAVAFGMSIQASFGFTAYQTKFYSLTFKFTPLKQLTAGEIYDWNNLGWQWDKRLTIMTVEYDISVVGQKVILDTLNGISGNIFNPKVQEFTLVIPPAVVNQPIGQSRVRTAFPVNDGIIAKEVRLRWDLAANTPSVNAPPIGKIFDVSFEPFEKYPPDIVPFTEWEDGGSPYLKYGQEITIEVNTGGVAVQFQIQADGATITNGTFTANTTINDRKRQFTFPPDAIGRNWRIFVDLTQTAIASGGGQFQLFRHNFTFLPADKGPVAHSPDWDDLGYPYDKRLQTVSLEYEGAGTGLQYNFDTLTGISGNTINPKAINFQLSGDTRTRVVLPVPDGNIVKAVKGYPDVTPPTGWHLWLYDFKPYIQLPADIVFFTDFKDFGYPAEKTCRSIWMKADTGGVPAVVQLELDGVVRYTFTVNTSVDNLMFTAPIQEALAVNNVILFRQARLLAAPGTNGKFQMWDWGIDFVKEPMAVTFIDTFETDFGYAGWKWIKQMWAMYICNSSLSVTTYRDTGTVFFQFPLPAHPKRDMERQYFPAILSNAVLNKSKRYRFQVSAADGTSLIRWYPDSRVEWMPWGGDQRQGFQQFPISSEQQLPGMGQSQ